jgi:hypothetical protein
LAPTAIDRSAGLYRPEQQAFAEAILETDDRYDIILIDAAPAFRSHCVEPALMRLSARAMIILDDAPFYARAAEALRNAGLTEFDFWALEANLWTASLFLSRDLQFAASDDAEPNVSMRQSRIRLDRAGNGEVIPSESDSGNLTHSGSPSHLS